MIKGFLDLSLQLPVGCPPYSNGPIVRASRQKLSNRIPAYTFDETLVLVDFA